MCTCALYTELPWLKAAFELEVIPDTADDFGLVEEAASRFGSVKFPAGALAKVSMNSAKAACKRGASF